MRIAALVALCVLFLSSCGKHESGPVTQNDPTSDKARQPVANEYPTVDEAELKGIVRTRFDSPNPTAAQLARRTANNTTIRGMGLPVLESLPVVEDELVAKLRSPEEIARRCLATTFCAVKGETKDQEFVDSLIKKYSAATCFSPKEQKFIENREPPQQDLVDFAWRYECVHVFLWALGLRDKLSAPSEICPVSEDMQLLKKLGPEKFVADAKRRSAREILDAADLYYRLHWAAINLRVHDKTSELLDEEIIRERHRALNWLIGYMNQQWDDVTTDT